MRFLWVAFAAVLAACQPQMAAAREAQDSIWPRLVARMQLVNDEQTEITDWARRYARDPAALRRMLARSEPFLWYIAEASERYKVPAEVALLPAIESGFDPRAASHQKAHGLWQFIPSTGRALGLQTTAYYDARRDPVASTDAAMRYLKSLHARFGDWHFALAAYNIGAARLSNLIREQPTKDFWALELPRETREHVRRLMAIALIVEKPHRFNMQLPTIANRPAAEQVVLSGPLDLRKAARHAGIREDLIATYNPGLVNLGNTSGKKTLLLPSTEAAQMRLALGQAKFPPRSRKDVLVHVVQPGDSLWRIANRYQISVDSLATHNGLQKTGAIRPGARIEVPTTSSS